jgi:CRP/FNR family transcriptional regulator, cyclic AMP receptor protein
MADTDKKLWYLSQINLFRDLPEETIKNIAATSQMRSFEKDFYISTPHDDTDERLYFLKEGEVEIYESSQEGKKMIIDILKPGDIFGYAAIASIDAPKQFIKTSRDATVCVMPKQDFLALLKQKPELALAVIKELSLQLSATESRLRDTALSNMETRVLQELKRLEDTGKLARKFTHEELAQLVGTTRETVTRTLTRLTAKKRIALNKKGHFTLRDPDH